MHLFIPTIGTWIVLLQPWSFQLRDEYRNYDLWVKLTNGEGPPCVAASNSSWANRYAGSNTTLPVTLPAGTKLAIDRLYIRKGNAGYDSVSFRILKRGSIPAGPFWARLD